MRSLLVNNEDLHRVNTQLNNEMKRMTEQMMEMERENHSMEERCREMEVCRCINRDRTMLCSYTACIDLTFSFVS